MNDIPRYLQLELKPVACAAAIVCAPSARFTILTSRLIRMEYDQEERFIDQASQAFWFREQPVPAYDVAQNGKLLEIETEHLHLIYRPGAHGFTPDNLSIRLKSNGEVWHFNDANEQNLRGTLRTLDMVSGSAPLEPGLLSRNGWVVVDDSRSLVFNDQCWLEPRPQRDMLDLYFFGYAHDYVAALQDYFKVAGQVPLLPRWALGNWWSRYWAYHQDELTALMREFRQHDVPLAVCIVDMDWHLTDTQNDCSGWTGYTWNRELFPDPEAFMRRLHEQGLKTALNLHPAEGIHAHEEAYDAMARFMGIDPETKERVAFDITDPHFVRGYFQFLHHPLEEQGVDFWWLDWQQGVLCNLPGLDPLWWLNHLHFYDHSRKGKRPFIFSRWGGLGNHRYPIGFSGDAIVNWPSLAFQPYLTATAANVGFGWWSHDIGGHMHGIEEPELYARWVQFGVLSPIMRLHSTKNPYHERRPWGYDAETFRVAREAMQLRHALIPYLYTMSWRNATEGISPIRPMYHDYPEKEEAYHCPGQYTFGSELIAAPYVAPANPHTRLSRQVIWLPEGDWFHFFDGLRYEGDAWHALHGALDDIPLLAKSGAIVPLGPKIGWGGVENPEQLDVVVFPGADNVFELFEDDGETMAFRDGAHALTRFKQAWQENWLRFTVEPVVGDVSQVPPRRQYRLLIRGVRQPDVLVVRINGEEQSVDFAYDDARYTVSLAPLFLSPEDELTVELKMHDGTLLAGNDQRFIRLKRMVETFRLETRAKAYIVERLAEMIDDPSSLGRYLDLNDAHLQALLEVIFGAGVHYTDHTGTPLILLWNNTGNSNARHRLTCVNPLRWRFEERFNVQEGPLPRFQAIYPTQSLQQVNWKLVVHYDDLLSLSIESGPIT